MCDTCGCNITPGNEHLVGHESVEVLKNLLDANDHQAVHNREHFARHNALAVNLMSSPGAGKTALLEATIDALGGKPLDASCAETFLRLAGHLSRSIESDYVVPGSDDPAISCV